MFKSTVKQVNTANAVANIKATKHGLAVDDYEGL